MVLGNLVYGGGDGKFCRWRAYFVPFKSFFSLDLVIFLCLTGFFLPEF